MNQKEWDQLSEKLEPARPAKGRRVIVTTGCHAGVIGTVTWHGRNRWKPSSRLSPERADLRELMGTIGYRVRIVPDDGSESFFVDADKVVVKF